MEKLTVTIEKLNSKGFGIARHNGKVYFVPWALPGDEVEIQVESEHAKYADARLISIIQRSPDRIEAPCPHFFSCGGCRLQHLDYAAQLRWKKVIVEDALNRITKSQVPVEDVLPSPNVWNYRNRIQVHQNRQGQWGFFEPQSHRVIEIGQCLISEETLNDQLKDLKSIPSKGPQTVELRTAGSEGGFTQVNTAQNQALIAKVLELLKPQSDEMIADVYCGAGNFSFPIASHAKKVIGMEKSLEALTEAQRKMRELKLEAGRIQWRQGSASRLLLQCAQENLRFDAMVLDPPRRGLEEALRFVVEVRPARIVMVSCDPATFARDVKGLTDAGYRLRQVQPLDMFPHTPHVEVVAALTTASDQKA